MADRLHLSKLYYSPFLVDTGKFSRITHVLEKAGGDSAARPAGFAVQFRTGRRLNLQSAEEVLALDNPKSDPIVVVELSTRGDNPSTSVKFDATDRSTPMIYLNVYHSDNKAANELYGELDEQVDRVLVKGFLGRTGFFARFLLTIALVLILLVMLGVAIPAPTQPTSPFETTLLQRARTATSDHDKLQILFDKTIHDLQPESPVSIPTSVFAPRTFFKVLPVVLVGCVLLYLIWFCYPFAVFAWGDREHEYQELLTRRRMLWTVVIAATTLGIVSNLFVASLAVFR